MSIIEKRAQLVKDKLQALLGKEVSFYYEADSERAFFYKNGRPSFVLEVEDEDGNGIIHAGCRWRVISYGGYLSASNPPFEVFSPNGEKILEMLEPFI